MCLCFFWSCNYSDDSFYMISLISTIFTIYGVSLCSDGRKDVHLCMSVTLDVHRTRYNTIDFTRSSKHVV
jgi:hypothetical protein